MKNVNEANRFNQLVYIRLTEACNMRCDHCFIPANPKKMSVNDCKKIPEILERISKSGDRIILQWHGGEPTLFGIHRFQEVLSYLNDSIDDRVIIHGIQTNLANYDSQWGELYKRYFQSRIGVSWDYKIRHARGEAFDSLFGRKVQQLSEDGIDFDLTITVSKPFHDWVLSDPSEFFSFIEKVRPKSLHLEKITKTGNARLNWPNVGLTNQQYSNLLSLIYLYSRSWMSVNKDWFDGISPLSDYESDIHSLVYGGELELRGCTSGVCDTRFHTIDSNGYKFGCTAINSEADNPAVKEVVSLITPKQLESIREVRVKSCDGCQFIKICNTGCVANTKVDESGECNGAFTLRNNILNIIKTNEFDETFRNMQE
ncbi:radical SAM protein [Photobacterium galatheae]|uniref:Radical SAM core domain-containing protein n=1 Tax=Photobacterium galatheae TaxID=1654360 RepID=A0A066RQH9_9GAMM|nr:radical SAM protein [Photobacterium galatheae]KDM89952.1 hypothetical protein EA58_19605 [Photobacterium galatheae]MCM0149253.1 radical SAM protein [Photobacterium galatheae]